MATFPILKTNAVAQYPAQRRLQHQNQCLRFVDGTEQRYRDSAGSLHRWDILLDELDDAEMTAIESFFLANQGAFATFPFTDPWDGKTYANCSLGSDGVDLVFSGEMQGAARMTVVENR